MKVESFNNTKKMLDFSKVFKRKVHPVPVSVTVHEAANTSENHARNAVGLGVVEVKITIYLIL